MKRWVRAAGLVVGLVATAASVWFIARAWEGQDLGAYASPAAMGGLACAVALYVVGVMLSAGAWRATLASMGFGNRWLELGGIVAVTQVGKYLPGNIAQHVGRVALAMDRGIGAVALVVTGLVEVALLALASVAVGGIALLVSGRYAPLAALEGTHVALAVLLLAAAIALAPLLARRYGPGLLARFAPSIAARAQGTVLPSAGAMARAFALYAGVYVAFGAGIVMMAHLLLDTPVHDGWLLVASFSLAWIVGFATPGAPAGLGVREAVMLLLLSGAYSAADAAAIVLAVRVATTIGDVVLLPVGWLQLRLASRPAGRANREQQ